MSQQHEQIVKQVNDAFRRNDIEGFLDLCTEGLTWTMAGEAENSGKAAIREWMGSMPGGDPPTFSVEQMISNEDSVVCYGDMKMNGPDGIGQAYSYCDIYRFESEKIADLHSFVVKKKSGEG